MFITFEGPEGAGKSTALKAIAERLTLHGTPVICTREPGGGEFGSKIRAILLDGDDVPPESEVLLFLADRANHIQNIILPAVAEGKVVLCDRHSDSTFVYQGYGRGFDLEVLRNLNNFATRGKKPDLTLLFDLDPEIGLERRRDRNRLDNEPLEFHKKVREGFLVLAQQEPERIQIINADQSPEAVFEVAWKIIQQRIGGMRD